MTLTSFRVCLNDKGWILVFGRKDPQLVMNKESGGSSFRYLISKCSPCHCDLMIAIDNNRWTGDVCIKCPLLKRPVGIGGVRCGY